MTILGRSELLSLLARLRRLTSSVVITMAYPLKGETDEFEVFPYVLIYLYVTFSDILHRLVDTGESPIDLLAIDDVEAKWLDQTLI